MTWFRAVQTFKYHDQRGREVSVPQGELVDILTKSEGDRLQAMGLICPREYSWEKSQYEGTPAKLYAATKRIGIFLKTTHHYSGGRIHMYQYALALARNGVEVYLITNARPRWKEDYPNNNNLRIIIINKDKIPKDLDLIVTDSKDDIGIKALMHWRRINKRIPFFCMNFETPNWVAHFDKGYADRLNTPKEVFKEASHYMANSNPSGKYLLEWLGKKNAPCFVMNPCVNTFAIQKMEQLEKNDKPRLPKLPLRPFVVWSARGPKYKGGYIALDAVYKLNVPLDIVCFGQPKSYPKSSGLHNIHRYEGKGDVAKFWFMKNAKAVLAPSKFEGYGMVPGEALAVGAPCIVYDLPVLREAYGDKLIYAKWNDQKDFCNKVKNLIEKGEPKIEINTKKNREDYGFNQMEKQMERIPFHIMKRKSISVQLISYWGFIPESLESVYSFADEIFVAYGRVPKAKEVNDGSLELIKSFPDPDNKIRIKTKDIWQGGKREMREWCAKQSGGNYMLLLDGDEIWTGLEYWIKRGIKFECPRWLNFWHDEKHWIYDTHVLAGTRWGKKLDPYGSICPHYRWSWWRPSYYFKKHPLPRDIQDNSLHLRDGTATKKIPQCVIYHLGHALPKKIMQIKHDFYLSRDGRDSGRIKRMDVWHKWKGKIGDVGDGIVQKVNWNLPDIVLRSFKSLRNLEERIK